MIARQIWQSALALGLGLASVALQAAETASPIAASDAVRADLIDRVSKSIIHVKGVRKAPPPVDPYAGLDDRTLAKMHKRDPELLRQSLARQAEPLREEGSAFIIDSARGLALTANHIVRLSTTITGVLPGGREVAVELVGSDEDTGISLLRIKDAQLPALAFATKRSRAGDTAMIVGRQIPFNTTLASQGMVMGDAFSDDADRGQLPLLAEFFALDNLMPNGGMGGGPVVNMKGEVTGLVSAIYGRLGYGQDAVTLALRVPELKLVIDQLVATGKVVRSFIGVTPQCEQSKCVVERVEKASPAGAAGIKSGDQILSVNGKPVTTESALIRTVVMTPVGAEVILSISSGAEKKTVVLKTIPRPANLPVAGEPADAAK